MPPNLKVLSKEEFLMYLNPQAHLQSSTSVPKPSALKLQNQSAKKSQVSEDMTRILKYMFECLEDEGITPTRFFK